MSTGRERGERLQIMAPAGTPTAIVDKLNGAINEVIHRPNVVNLWAKQGAIPMSMTPQEFDTYLRADIMKPKITK